MKIYRFFFNFLVIALLAGIGQTVILPVPDVSALCSNEADCECKGPNCPIGGGYKEPPPPYSPLPGPTHEELSWDSFSVGYSLMKDGHLKEAAEKFQDAIDHYPLNTNAYIELGHIYEKWGNYRKAAEMYQKAIDLGDTNAVPDLNALRDRMNKEEAEAANSQGVAYARLGDYDKAIEFYEKALRIRPGYWLAQDNLRKLKSWLKSSESRKYEDEGVKYENLGLLEIAKGNYKKALEIDPNNTVVKTLLRNLEIRILREEGLKYAKNGNADKAREFYREILRLDPDNPYARERIEHMDEWIAAYKGGEAEKNGEYVTAAEYYQKALNHNPAYTEARSGLTRVAEHINDRAVEYHKSGDDVRAREFLNKVLELDPGNGYARKNLRKLDINESNKAGAQSMDEGDYEKAIDHFRKVLDLDPENEYARGSLHEVTVKQGTANIHRGSFSAAARYYRQALNIDPDNEEAQEKLRMAKKVIGWKQAITGRDGEVPLPALPSEEEIEEKFIDINLTEWPAMKAALSLAGEIKERAKTETEYFLKVQAVEQLYRSTIGKYKIVQITRELGETYRQMRESQFNIMMKPFRQSIGTMGKVLTIGRSAHSTVDDDEEYSRIIKTGEETRGLIKKDLKGKFREAGQQGWESMIKTPEASDDISRVRAIRFKRGESMESRRLSPLMRD